MHVHIRSASIATATLLVFGGIAPAAQALDDTASGEGIPGLIDSASIAGPALISGVLSRDSKTADAGAQVTLYAWPSGDQLSKLNVGDAVKKYPVGFAFTDDSGAFELRISDRSSLAKYKTAEGDVDFEVVGLDDGGLYLSYFTASSQDIEGIRAGKKDVVVESLKDVSPRFEAPTVSADGGAVEKACTTVKRANLGPFPVTVGYGYTYASGTTMRFTYTSGASSTLGVATSASGKDGTFSASGTSTISSTDQVEFPTTNSFKAWKTNFRYGKYETNCVSGGPAVYVYFTAMADGFAGGSSVQTISGAPSATYCVSNVANSNFTKASTTAYESSVGVGTSGKLGINVSARTGYSQTAKLKFSFANAAKLCGTHDYPGGSPKRLVAKP